MSLTNIVFVLALVFTGQISPAEKPAKSARVGDLLVTATRVWFPQVPAHSDRFHWVRVDVTVKNVSEGISRTRFGSSLKVKPDWEYGGGGRPVGGAKGPDIDQLLPGEDSTGALFFEVRNGTTPVALILDYFCAPKKCRASIELAGIVETENPR